MKNKAINILLIFMLYSCESNSGKIINDYIIDFDNNNKIYVSARAWGMTGNHQEIVLSNMVIDKEHRSYSKDEVFIFYSSEIYYKKNENELIIYTNLSSVSRPKKFKSPIQIIIENLKNSKELQDYEKNYLKYGLEKISIRAEKQ